MLTPIGRINLPFVLCSEDNEIALFFLSSLKTQKEIISDQCPIWILNRPTCLSKIELWIWYKGIRMNSEWFLDKNLVSIQLLGYCKNNNTSFCGLYKKVENSQRIILTADEREFNEVVKISLNDYIKIPRKPLVCVYINEIEKDFFNQDIEVLINFVSLLSESKSNSRSLSNEIHLFRMLKLAVYMCNRNKTIMKYFDEFKKESYNKKLSEDQWRTKLNEGLQETISILLERVKELHHIGFKYY